MQRYWCVDCDKRFKKYHYYKNHLRAHHSKTPYIYYDNVYSKLRIDRSGARILNMLYCYSYCFNNNTNYAGAIIDYNFFKDKGIGYQHLDDCSKLCSFLKLPVPINQGNIKETQWQILHDDIYAENIDHDLVFNEKFRNHLSSTMCDKTYAQSVKPNKNDYVVAIHLRRGDVTPDSKWGFRYTPNRYYLDLIDAIQKKKPNAKIYVFSETKTHEPFDEFIKKGCILKLSSHTTVVETWIYMIYADLFITSKSAFSIVPAIYSKNKIMYVDFKYFKSLNHWISGSLHNKIQWIENNL